MIAQNKEKFRYKLIFYLTDGKKSFLHFFYEVNINRVTSNYAGTREKEEEKSAFCTVIDTGQLFFGTPV